MTFPYARANEIVAGTPEQWSAILRDLPVKYLYAVSDELAQLILGSMYATEVSMDEWRGIAAERLADIMDEHDRRFARIWKHEAHDDIDALLFDIYVAVS